MIEQKVKRPFLRAAGNGLSDARLAGFTALSAEVIYKQERHAKFRSRGLAVRAAVLFLTDIADGKLVRASNLPNPGGGEKDERNDKNGIRLILGALRLATGDSRYSDYMLATEVRNHLIAIEREKLREAGVSADSRMLGKAKMWLQAAAVVADLSPLGDSNPELVHKMHLAAVGAAVVSGVDFKLHSDRQLFTRQQEI